MFASGEAPPPPPLERYGGGNGGRGEFCHWSYINYRHEGMPIRWMKFLFRNKKKKIKLLDSINLTEIFNSNSLFKLSSIFECALSHLCSRTESWGIWEYSVWRLLGLSPDPDIEQRTPRETDRQTDRQTDRHNNIKFHVKRFPLQYSFTMPNMDLSLSAQIQDTKASRTDPVRPSLPVRMFHLRNYQTDFD
jgi:hypothetical protein